MPDDLRYKTFTLKQIFEREHPNEVRSFITEHSSDVCQVGHVVSIDSVHIVTVDEFKELNLPKWVERISDFEALFKAGSGIESIG
ncbi:MAG: hypothetical protein UT34_C0002G0096 [candidate division WS6 bacterium GW2011_GWF2_39_15]|uniref:Uncharacterized protein n=1 Tax=candidate division WS6 bacterium GW2011_GWF2_39_15 TaxID=1619100 RepID=A0A0G0MNG2_9BACT|nr:MAG: hypothetical protein UT34_C0002G0096 [candidate division WS6 bacterium GW2011_GWF2_39_15]